MADNSGSSEHTRQETAGGDKACTVSTSTPNSSYLRWRLDHHHLRRPPEQHSVGADEPARAPTILADSEDGKTNLVLVHLKTSSSRQPLDVLDIGTSQTLVDSTQTLSSTVCPIWRLPELESCCGSRVLEDYATMLIRSSFISSTWCSSHSTFTAVCLTSLPESVALDGDNPGRV